MKKSKYEGKVVPFPNLQQRLLDKGMEALQQKKFEEALELLQQTLKLDDQLHEVQLGIVICMLELDFLDEAKERCQAMLQQDIGDYYEVLQIFITILIQLQQYDEVEMTIEAVLQEGKIPPHTVENFYRLLDFSRKMTTSDHTEKPLMEVERLLEDISISEQWSIVQALRNERLGISFAYDTVDKFLQNESKHPMIKTAILHMFIEKEIQRSVEIEKFGQHMNCKTEELHATETHFFTLAVLQQLDDTLGNENPSLFEVVKEMWHRHLYVMYPFIPSPEEASTWAAGLHKIGYDFHGIDVEPEEIADLYNIASTDLVYCCGRIREIEEISWIE
ncbi:tetratricopeptide repeat protein [Bacillus sp. DJP31]|uniref:tetratricopeptide repeat protein n=1 Tax=Bacillus sp. DJP31 TaxID=3409789 RepID=UPI003BB49AC9